LNQIFAPELNKFFYILTELLNREHPPDAPEFIRESVTRASKHKKESKNNRTPEENAEKKMKTAALCSPGLKSHYAGLLLCKEKR
jgi:hypothetical protein